MRTIKFILYVVLILAVSESVLAACSKFSSNRKKCIANPDCTYTKYYDAERKLWRRRCWLAKPPRICWEFRNRRECENKDGCEWSKAASGWPFCRKSIRGQASTGTNIPTQLPSGPTDSGFVSGAGGQSYNQPSFEPNALLPPPPQILGSNTEVWEDGLTNSGFVFQAGANPPSFDPNAPHQILESNTEVWEDGLTDSGFVFQAGANPPSFDPNAFNPPHQILGSNTKVWEDGLTDSAFVFRAGANTPSFDPNAFNPSHAEVWQDGLTDSGFVFRAGANPPSFVPSIMHPPCPNLESVAEVLAENDLGSVPYPAAAVLWELEARNQLHDPFVEAQNVFYEEIEQHPAADCWTRKTGEPTAASMDEVREVMNSLLDCTPAGANGHLIVDERWTDEDQAMVDEALKDAMEGPSFQSNNVPFNYHTMDTLAVDASAMATVNREMSDLANNGNVASSSSIPSSAHAKSLKRPRSEGLPEPFFALDFSQHPAVFDTYFKELPQFEGESSRKRSRETTPNLPVMGPHSHVCTICGQGVHNSICPLKPVYVMSTIVNIDTASVERRHPSVQLDHTSRQ